MKQTLKFGAIPLLALVSLSACTDDKYDLSDIDTTTTIKVKDLVLPVNVEPITFGDIITINDDDQIKVVEINGQKYYAVSEGGTFTSSDITIDKFVSPSPQLQSYKVQFRGVGAPIPSGSSVEMPFPDKIIRKVTYKAESLDEAIESVDEIFLEGTSFNIYFSTDEIANADLSVKNVSLKLPVGLEVTSVKPAGTYDVETGRCVVSNVPLKGGKGAIEIDIASINLNDDDSKITDDPHDLIITTSIDIESASFQVDAKGTGATLPSNIDVDIDYGLDDMEINGISGTVNYALDNIHIDPVDLSNIPDIFSQEGTNIVLDNPQIYLNFNNPVANYHLDYQVGLSLTSERDNEAPKTFSLDDGTFKVGYSNGVAGPYDFCLSPKAPQTYLEGFEGAKHVSFSDLGEVLSGNGLPKKIQITLPDTRIYSQYVDHFKLGEENKLDGMRGRWEFFAPLALTSDGGNDSKIIYSKTQDGWSDEEVDAITIEVLQLTATVDSDLPVSATLSGYPIDINGNQINGAKFEPVVIPAGAKNHEIVLSLTGKVSHLDGITYTAEITGSNGEALSPNQKLSLKDIRVKVSGNYTKEF